MDFVAFDVETANPDLASICQVGVVVFRGGRAVDGWRSLVNPEADFHRNNIAVHGIGPHAVAAAPTLPAAYGRLGELFAGRVVAHHSAFDRTSVGRVAARYGLPPIGCTWLDTARVARRAWPALAPGGYGLANVARSCGITFRHHAADEDARAAGEILVRAIGDTGLALPDWVARLGQAATAPIGAGPGRRSLARRGDPAGPLVGEAVAFTGSLAPGRQGSADLAAAAGCNVGAGVTRATTLLVVGGLDIGRHTDAEESSKHRRAEALQRDGQALRIVGEGDFLALIGSP